MTYKNVFFSKHQNCNDQTLLVDWFYYSVFENLSFNQWCKNKKVVWFVWGVFFWFDWLISCHTLQIYHFIKFCKNNCRLFISWLVDWFIIQNCKCIVINFDQSAVFITFILIAAVLSLINNNVFQIYDCLSIGKEYTKN